MPNNTASTIALRGRLNQLANASLCFFTIRLIDTDGKPISDHLRVTVARMELDRKVETLAESYTDQKGEFRFSVQTIKDGDGSTQPVALPIVAITILGLDEDDSLGETQWKLDAKDPAKIIKVDSLAAFREKLKAPLAKLPDEVKPKDAALNQFLQQKKIATLEQVRQLASDSADKLGTAARDEFRRLKAHAELQLLSRNAKIADALYKADFNTLGAIAETPRPEFLGKLKGAIAAGLLDGNKARELHESAQRQIMVLNNVYIENAVNKVHRPNAKAAMQAMVSTPPQGCNCDCQSAVSPLAYLTDLLDYALSNARRSSARLTFDDLIATFSQPFRDLPLDCAASETLVRQVRLCVEVLRARLGTNQPATEHYRQNAYEALLRELGTSRNELRATRLSENNDANGQKARVAQKLGIATARLNDLILNDTLLTEQNLERIFGLQDTIRDPLSVGAKFGDTANHIKSWSLAGVEWRRNTDANGRIYVSLARTDQGPQPRYSVRLYWDSSRHQLVASGESEVNSGSVDLIEVGGSGLRGRFAINYQSDLQASIAAVPEYVAWRLQALEQQWKETDWPAASLLDESKLPIVEPDLVSDTDFYQPYDANSAYKLYKHRREWMDNQHKRLDRDPTNNASCTAAEMLALMIQPLTYDPLSGARVTVTPWPAQPNWEAVANDLGSANEAKISQRLSELKQFALSPESFAFLNVARVLSNDDLDETNGDRDRVLDVLLFVLKKKFYDAWRVEEGNSDISLTPPFFLLHANGATLHPLRLAPDHRSLWEQELERNTRAPLVDPDLIDPEWLSADEVYTLHAERSKALDRYYNALVKIDSRAELGNALKNGNLQVTDGAQTVGQWHALGLTEDFIKASLDAVEKQRPLPQRPEQFGLTTSEFLTLLEVWNLANASSSQADDRDWANVHHILLQSEKRRFLYTEWRKEERNQDIIQSPQHFKLPENPLRRFLPPRPLADLGAAAVTWRFESRLLRDWRSSLEPRFEQQQNVSDSVSAAVDRAEEATLPGLRDLLVDQLISNADAETTAADPKRVEKKKRYGTNRYLINMADSECRKTTRVAQAIETLQLLFWGIRTGQYEDSRFTLALATEEFDKEWRWLGSYATWRTAMFVFLYPENLLAPNWRNENEQTEMFKLFLKVMEEWPILVANHEWVSTEEGGREAYLLSQLVGSLKFNGPFDAEDYLSDDWLDMLESWIRIARRQLDGVEPGEFSSVEAALEERIYIPLYIALKFCKTRNWEKALEWFRQVYDYSGAGLNPEIDALLADFGTSTSFVRNENTWLEDELDPHKIGRTRANAYQRYILLSIAKCLLDYAESEFTIDTTESLARARENYDTALRLLDDEVLKQTDSDCGALAEKLKIEVGDYTYTTRDIRDYLDDGRLVGVDIPLLEKDLDKIEQDSGISFSQKRQKTRELLFSNLRHKPSPNAQTRVKRVRAAKARTFETLLADPGIANRVQYVGSPLAAKISLNRNGSNRTYAMIGGSVIRDPVRTRRVSGTPFEFCIPRNPMVNILRRRAESGLRKLNNCMNLAGLKREVPAYAAATDTSSGLPMLGVGTALQVQATNPQPTQYRYKVLVERAKQLASMAQQMEASYLSFLEKRDQEAYTLLKARQDLKIADANVTLQDLRLDEAENQKELAGLQYDKVDFIREHYQTLIDEGLNENEEAAIFSYQAAFLLQGAVMIAGAIAGGAAASATGPGAVVGAGAGAAAGALATAASGGELFVTGASYFSMLAGFDRRKEEWEFQRDLAEDFDLAIAEFQVDLAQDHYDIVEQEKRIAELGAQNASDVASFLENKFTSAELYEWMSGVVGDIYRYFLQQATSMARMAQRQLAFERQGPETGFILNDYWTYTETASFFHTEDGQDRRGLTGSARLLQDVTKLDQHAFLSDQRRLQLSKTLSLAALDPVAFHQFRETGVLPFATSMELFDRDFPGHYVRLIKRVRCTVVALIPPIDGIKATLSTNGISRVVRGGDMFEQVEVKRLPDQVALTAPVNATGVFELQEQPEMLLPFEGNGLATSWEFRLPKSANRFDYNTIADVLVTIDYTALDSDVYGRQVIEALDPQVSLERPFSFRQQFADQWYDLHHSDLVQEPQRPLVVTFTTRRRDFPANLDDLRIQHVTLYFARHSGSTQPVLLQHLHFREQGRAGALGGIASVTDGIAGTRQGNAPSWTAVIGKSPVGEWELALPDTEDTRALFDEKNDDRIEDILFVITFGGTTPEWPR